MTDVPPIPILDSLAHPTLTGKWLGRPLSADFDRLQQELIREGYLGACAVGLDDIEGYNHELFADRCLAYPGLIPIAAVNPERDGSIAAMGRLRTLGYRGVKIHPRFSRLTRRLNEVGSLLRVAGEVGLPVFYCTYMHCTLRSYPTEDPLYALVKSLQEAPETKVVLVHGGDVSLMKYAELVRFNDNLLLDLSLTIMKYQGSSLDADLAFLFERFDRRICIGSDWPEYAAAELRQRFTQFGRGLAVEKQRNIAYANLLNFLGIGEDFRALVPV